MAEIWLGIYLAGVFVGFVVGFVAHTIHWYREFNDVAFMGVVASMILATGVGFMWPLALLAAILWGIMNLILEKIDG